MTCPSTAAKLNYNFDGTLCDPFTLHMTQCTCISFPLTPQLEMIFSLNIWQDVSTVGKQSPWCLPFVYTSQVRLTVQKISQYFLTAENAHEITILQAMSRVFSIIRKDH